MCGTTAAFLVPMIALRGLFSCTDIAELIQAIVSRCFHCRSKNRVIHGAITLDVSPEIKKICFVFDVETFEQGENVSTQQSI
jgi:hypothetical protein